MEEFRCQLCERVVPEITRHHLIPRTRHSTKRNKRTFDRDEVQRTALLCHPCHKQIHVLFDEKELEQELNTLERLRTHPELAKFINWVRDKPGDLKVSSYRSGRRRPTRRSGPR